MQNGKRVLFSVQDIALIPLFVAFITVCSFVRIPFGTIPFTLQTFGVFVTVGVLGAKRGVTTIMVYILMGMIGLPVFGGAGGIAVLAGNTGGYITGFVLSAVVIGIMNASYKNRKQTIKFAFLVVSMVVGDIVCMAVGTIQFMVLTGVELTVALTYCVVPFIIPDLIKIVVATGFVERIKKIGGTLLEQ